MREFDSVNEYNTSTELVTSSEQIVSCLNCDHKK